SVTLSSAEGAGRVGIFFGPFFAQPLREIGPEPRTFKIETPPRLKGVPADLTARMSFSPRVVRLMMHQSHAVFHGVEGDVRPPRREETPALRMLSYGTSITHGAAATAFHLTYVAQTAWRLDADLCNLGLGGACHCEPALADYMAQRDDWDFATLCLSVNMIGAGFTLEEFRERTRYLIGRLAENPRRPVACIEIFPYFRDWGEPQPNAKAHPDDFRVALAEVVGELNRPNVHIIEGRNLLTDIGGLTVDCIHPSDFGMIQIGENLASRLRPIVEPLR
ncbi:MAG: GDSL-type esterase/lipase family protein, partial [Candidatus Sumerlaeota bacterium]|nr:GDSL-type esterase/lipase family protein [Candidatus Sumerlaeota bacterium]